MGMLQRCRVSLCARLIVSQSYPWRRLRVTTENVSSQKSAQITLIPMLHVASISFYDTVLRYIADTMQQSRSTVVLIEGLLDSESQRIEQEEESRSIFHDDKLRTLVSTRAKQNELFSSETLRDMCSEMHVDFNALQKFSHSDASSSSPSTPSSENLEASASTTATVVRLQDAYFRPLLTSLCGDRVVHADLTFEQCFQTANARTPSGTNSPWLNGESLVHIGRHPQVKSARERHCALDARARISECFEGQHQQQSATTPNANSESSSTVVDCHVVIPWGIHHMDGLVHALKNGLLPAPLVYRGQELQQQQERDVATPLGKAMALTVAEDGGVFREENFGLPPEFASTFR